jgi:ribosome recycling factor
MSTIAIIAIVVGAVILIAFIATRLARPRIDVKRRERARAIRGKAEERRVRAEHARAGANEQRARARRETLEAEQRERRADEELQEVGRQYGKARRVDPDRR